MNLNRLLAIVLASLYLFPCFSARASNISRTVLVLHSDQMILPAYQLIDKAIYQKLTESDKTINIYYEYMEFSRITNEAYRQQLTQFYRNKYYDQKLDLIISIDIATLQFLIKYGQQVFPGIPTVFAEVWKPQLLSLAMSPNMTGVISDQDIKGTLETTIKLHPGTKHLMVITGTSQVDRSFEYLFRQGAAGFENTIEITYLNNLSWDDLLKKLSQLPANAIVFYLSLFRDATGRTFVPRDVLPLISKASSAPVYGILDTYLGHGIVGGNLLNHQLVGQKAAELGLRILRGEKPTDIPAIKEGVYTYMFDWRQLKRWGLDEESLPPGSIVRYKEFSLWDQYRWYFIAGGFFSLLEAFLICLLVINRSKRLKANKTLLESENKFKNFSEQSLVGIYMIQDGFLRYVNPKFAEIFGYTVEECLDNMSFNDLVYPEDSAIVPENMVKRLPKRSDFISYEIRCIKKNGEIIKIEIFGSSIFLNGKTTGIGTLLDVTERKRVEEVLRTSEEHLRIIAENTYDWEYWRAPDGTYLWVSPSCETISGYPPENLIGNSATFLIEIIHPEDRHIWTNHLVEVDAHTDYHGLVEFRLVKPSGELVWISHTCKPIYNDHGVFLGRRGCNRDITENKRGEEERKQLQAHLLHAQKMESVGVLAGGIAHDFNNLLQIINGYTQLLLMDKNKHDQNYAQLNRILKAGNRAADLVRQLLLFSRKGEIKLGAVRLNREVEYARRILERTVPKMIEIELHAGRGLWDIMADPAQIEQILLNLGKNAADAMPDGGKLIIETKNLEVDEGYAHIHLGVEPGRYVLLAVSDTGHGMDRDTVEHIFEPFFTTKEVGKGTGLGLASVYGIVKSHGGYITCQSSVGQGTTFNIYLPATEDTDAHETKSSVPQLGQGGTETILLVDDEDSIRDVAKLALLNLGYKVLTAVNGEQALEIYADKGNSIELVILDLGMPGMGGDKCVREIIGLDPTAKVIIASGYSDEQVKKTLAAGASGFIGKPYQLDDLCKKVRAVLDEKDEAYKVRESLYPIAGK